VQEETIGLRRDIATLQNDFRELQKHKSAQPTEGGTSHNPQVDFEGLERQLSQKLRKGLAEETQKHKSIQPTGADTMKRLIMEEVERQLSRKLQ
jgi:hypothetical protein